MNVQPIRKEQTYKDNVVQFKQNKDIKLKKDGTPKRTINNTKLNRDNVQPFKEEDIPKMVKYFKGRVDKVMNREKETIARRDLSMYIMGINIGLRVSDLVTLRWNDIYNDDWTFRDGKSITPKKTSKSGKHVLLKYNNDFRKAIEYFRQYCDVKKIDSYIFKSREGGHISENTVSGILKKAAKEVGVEYNIASHSLRKTFARLRYDNSNDKSKTLVELMVLFGHSSPSVTKHYICISEEELDALYNDVSIGFDAIFD